MRLSELVSSLGLWIYPVIGLIGFLVAFMFVLWRATRETRSAMSDHAHLPLEDDAMTPEVHREG